MTPREILEVRNLTIRGGRGEFYLVYKPRNGDDILACDFISRHNSREEAETALLFRSQAIGAIEETNRILNGTVSI